MQVINIIRIFVIIVKYNGDIFKIKDNIIKITVGRNEIFQISNKFVYLVMSN